MHKNSGTSSTNVKKHSALFLKSFRKSIKRTQQDFAKIIGVDRSTYAKKESGKVPLTLDEWIEILTVLRKDHNISARLHGEPQLLPGSPRETFLPETIQVFPVLKKIISESNEAANSRDKKLLIKILEYAIDKLKETETPAEIPEVVRLSQNDQ
jgi:DNA-binding XRE family transcriptional regulator